MRRCSRAPPATHHRTCGESQASFITHLLSRENTFWHFSNLTNLDHTLLWLVLLHFKAVFQNEICTVAKGQSVCWKTDLLFKPFSTQRGPLNHALYTSGRGFTASPQGGRSAWWRKHDRISLQWVWRKEKMRQRDCKGSRRSWGERGHRGGNYSINSQKREDLLAETVKRTSKITEANSLSSVLCRGT